MLIFLSALILGGVSRLLTHLRSKPIGPRPPIPTR